MDEKVRRSNCTTKYLDFNSSQYMSLGWKELLAINDKIENEKRILQKLVGKEKADLCYNFLVKIAYENLYESNSSFILKKLREMNKSIELDSNAAD